MSRRYSETLSCYSRGDAEDAVIVIAMTVMIIASMILCAMVVLNMVLGVLNLMTVAIVIMINALSVNHETCYNYMICGCSIFH